MIINKKITIPSVSYNSASIMLPFSPSMAIDGPDCYSEPHRVRVLYDNDISIPSRWCPSTVTPRPGGWFGIAFPNKYVVTSVCVLDYNYSPPTNYRIRAGKFSAAINNSFSPVAYETSVITGVEIDETFGFSPHTIKWKKYTISPTQVSNTGYNYWYFLPTQAENTYICSLEARWFGYLKE